MASDHETSRAAARSYAEALFALAQEQGRVAEVEAHMGELAALWRREKPFADLMSSAAIDEDHRRESLRRAFTNRIDPLVLNLLLVLNDRNRSMILPEVCTAFRGVADERQNREQVFVTTAIPMSDVERSKLAAELQRLIGHIPVLNERVDPAVLGGMVVQVGDRLVDRSIRLRLWRMRRELSLKMERHLYESGERFLAAG